MRAVSAAVAVTLSNAAFCKTAYGAPPRPQSTVGASRPEGSPAPAATAVKPLVEALTGQPAKDYAAGKILFADGDFSGALVKFESAFLDTTDPRLLWNMAACEKNLRHYATTVQILEHYVRDAGPILSEGDRKEAEQLIVLLHPFTTTLTVSVNEPGAQVQIDDKVVGRSPRLEPALVDLGGHKVRVTKAGYREHLEAIVATGNTHVTLAVTLERDVHEGKIAVHAPPLASISFDDNVVGKGTWEAAVASGTHVLRVTAPGSLGYENAIVITDNSMRVVDVVLQHREVAPVPPPRVVIERVGPPLWAWLTGSAVVALAASVGGAFVYRSIESR